MELKKNPKADLEKRKGLFLEIGFVVILAACLVAFTWKSYDDGEEKVNNTEQAEDISELDDIMDTDQQDEQPPEEQPQEEPELNMEEIEIVEDNQTIEVEATVNAEMTDESTNTSIAEVKIEEEQDEEEVKIFTVVENDPEFPGGMEALYKYLAENIKYPQLARDNGITGKVYVTFVVERDGSIANPKILRDIGGGCGQEAIRVVKSMPKWTPGKQRGKAVRVQFNLPVNFNLK